MSRAAHSKMNAAGRRIAIRLLSLQFTVAAVFIAVFWVTQGAESALTALAGAVIALVPNIVFATYAFKFSGARAAHYVVQSFYAGEALKQMLNVVLFIIAFLLLSGPWLPLFVTYAVIVLMHWLAPILIFKTN